MGEALHDAEEEQGCGEAAQHTEPVWNPAGEAEEVVDVVQDHEHQGDGLQSGGGQAPWRSNLGCCGCRHC